MSEIITNTLDVPGKIKKAGVPFTLAVLVISVVGLGFAVVNLYADESDTRLAVLETRMDEMDKKLDKMDGKLDRLLER